MKRALLVIDVQNEYFIGKLPVSHPAGSLQNVLKTMEAAAGHGIPVIIIQHTSARPDAVTFRKGSSGWEIHPEVASKPYDYLLEKNFPGSFTGTTLEEILKKEGIDTVAISSYMTQMCCDTTARQALHLGYKVEFLSDATGTLAVSNQAGSVDAEELHRCILVTQAMMSNQVLSTEEWLQKL